VAAMTAWAIWKRHGFYNGLTEKKAVSVLVPMPSFSHSLIGIIFLWSGDTTTW